MPTLHRESFEAVVGTWPLTVNDATVVCGTKNKNSLGVEFNGKTYALNGTANTFENWPGLEPVWAPNPATGALVSVGDLLDYAARQCVNR